MYKFVFTVDDSPPVFPGEYGQLEGSREMDKELNRVPLRMAVLT